MTHNKSNERKTTGQIRWQSKKRKEMLLNLDSNQIREFCKHIINNIQNLSNKYIHTI